MERSRFSEEKIIGVLKEHELVRRWTNSVVAKASSIASGPAVRRGCTPSRCSSTPILPAKPDAMT